MYPCHPVGGRVSKGLVKNTKGVAQGVNPVRSNVALLQVLYLDAYGRAVVVPVRVIRQLRQQFSHSAEVRRHQ